MRHKLYEFKTYRDRLFNREAAVKHYRQIMKSRKVFASAINVIIEGSPKGKQYAPPLAAQNLRDYLRHWKAEFNGMQTIPAEMVVRRRYHGQTIEVDVETRITKRCPVTGRTLETATTAREKSRALKSVMEKIRQMRRREKHIEYDGTINTRITNRETNGLLREFNGKRLRLPKRPKDDGNYVGIEIECIMPSGIDLTPLFPFSKYIEVGGDGSIEHKHDEDGIEIKVCVVKEDLRKVLPDLMQTMKDMGARVNKSCGLHVHLDQRNNTEPEKAFQKLVRSLGLLYTVVPESRRRNKYCKRNRHADFTQAVRGERYKAINASAFHKYHTIEVRLFGGSLEAIKIINWIEILLAIAYGEMVMRCPKTFDTALKYWKLSEENLAWLKERQTKFSTINAGMPVSEHETEPNQALLDETQDDEDETCGECENALDDCSCEQECDCGDCGDCTERREEEERASQARAVRRSQMAAQEAERRRIIEEQQERERQAQSNVIISQDISAYRMWIGGTPPQPEPLTLQRMQDAVEQIQNTHVERMEANMNAQMFSLPMYNDAHAEMFNREYNAEFLAIDPAVIPLNPPPATPESNDERLF